MIMKFVYFKLYVQTMHFRTNRTRLMGQNKSSFQNPSHDNGSTIRSLQSRFPAVFDQAQSLARPIEMFPNFRSDWLHIRHHKRQLQPMSYHLHRVTSKLTQDWWTNKWHPGKLSIKKKIYVYIYKKKHLHIKPTSLSF